MEGLYRKSNPKLFERRIIFREVLDPVTQHLSNGKDGKNNNKHDPEIMRNGLRNSSKSSVGYDRPSKACVEDASSVFASKEYLEWSMISPIGPGFNNRGNTCFLNSVLQCLVYTPPMANFFLLNDHRQSCRNSGFCAACGMADIVRMCHKKNHGHRSAITPNMFVTRLHVIAKTMKAGRQEDSHEFMRFLIESVGKGFMKSSAFDPTKAMFGFELESTVTCYSCKKASKHRDPAMDLSLDIKNCDSVEKAFKLFSKPDILSGKNRYNCEHCKKPRDAAKHMNIATAPNVLCIQLKRFEFTAYGQQKLNRFVSYPEYLNMPLGSGSQMSTSRYQLYGVLVHSGNSNRSGHYYAFVRSPANMWYCMNDSDVTQVKSSQVLKQSAYMLFYVACTTPTQQSSTRSLTTLSQKLPPTPPASPHSSARSSLDNLQSPIAPRKHIITPSVSSKSTINEIFVKKQKKDHRPVTVSVEKTSKNPLAAATALKETIQSSEEKSKSDIESVILSEPRVLNDTIVVKWNDKKQDKLDKLDKVIKLESSNRERSAFDLEHEVKAQDIVKVSSRKQSSRPKNYDIEYDEGKKRKRKERKAWRVFELQKESNPFTKAQISSNKKPRR
eukprot:Partr_v1_DN27544_c0_g1_i2_m30446 putative ubiquitin carboxyl-terminal hydrolase